MEPTSIVTTLGTAFDAIKTDVMGVIAVALPVAAGLVGTFLAVKMGIKFFKGVAH